MFLTGAFHRSLDEKLRFAIPKPLRDAIGHPSKSVLYLAPGTEGSLALYTEDAFERLAGRLEQGSPNGRNVRAFSRLFYAQVQRVEIDKQSRVRLSADLARLAGVQKEIVLVGVRDHLEIWDRTRWEEYLSETQPHYDELAENAFTGRISDSMTARPEPPAMQPSDADTRPVQPR